MHKRPSIEAKETWYRSKKKLSIGVKMTLYSKRNLPILAYLSDVMQLQRLRDELESALGREVRQRRQREEEEACMQRDMCDLRRNRDELLDALNRCVECVLSERRRKLHAM